MNNSLISDEDYKQPLTPASAKTAYNQYVYKLHEATGISEPFRHLDSVLMRGGKTCILVLNIIMRRSLSKELDQCWNQLPLAKVKSFGIT